MTLESLARLERIVAEGRAVAGLDEGEWTRLQRRVRSLLPVDAEPRVAYLRLCEAVLHHRGYRHRVRLRASLLTGEEAFAAVVATQHLRSLERALAKAEGEAEDCDWWAQLERRFTKPDQQFTSEDLHGFLHSLSEERADELRQPFRDAFDRVADSWTAVDSVPVPTFEAVLLVLARADAPSNTEPLTRKIESIIAEEVLPALVRQCRSGIGTGKSQLRKVCEGSVRAAHVHVTGLEAAADKVTQLTDETLEDLVTNEPPVRSLKEVQLLASRKAREWSQRITTDGADALLRWFPSVDRHLREVEAAYLGTVSLKPTPKELTQFAAQELQRLVDGGELLRLSRESTAARKRREGEPGGASKKPVVERTTADMVSAAAAIGVWRPALDALLPYVSHKEQHQQDDAVRALEAGFGHRAYSAASRVFHTQRVAVVRDPRAQQAADDALVAVLEILARPCADLKRLTTRIAKRVGVPLLPVAAEQAYPPATLPAIEEPLRLAVTWPVADRFLGQSLLTAIASAPPGSPATAVDWLTAEVRDSAEAWRSVASLLAAAEGTAGQGLVPISSMDGRRTAELLLEVQRRARTRTVELYDAVIRSTLGAVVSSLAFIEPCGPPEHGERLSDLRSQFEPDHAIPWIEDEIARCFNTRRAGGLPEGDILSALRTLAYSEAELHCEVQSAVRRFIRLATVRPLRGSVGTDKPANVVVKEALASVVARDSLDVVTPLLVEHIRVPVTNLATYVTTSAANNVRRELRRHETDRADSDAALAFVTREWAAPDSQWRATLKPALRRLDKQKRKLLLSVWRREDTFSSLAGRLGLAEEQVRKRYSRAKRALVMALDLEDAVQFLVALQSGSIDDGAARMVTMLPSIRSGDRDLRAAMTEVLVNVAKDLAVFDRRSVNQANFADWLHVHGNDPGALRTWEQGKWTTRKAGLELVARVRRRRASQTLPEEVRREEEALLARAASSVDELCDAIAGGEA